MIASRLNAPTDMPRVTGRGGFAGAFDKIAMLHAVAPTGKEQPFAIGQGLPLVLFIVLGYLALRKYCPAK